MGPRPDTDSRLHHISHGTLGIVLALARVGRATSRADLVDLALVDAADTVARDEAGPEGFLVVHSTPQYFPDAIDPLSYGWCPGPAGDAQVSRLLRDVTADDPLARPRRPPLAHSHPLRAALPRRLRPGFWPNNGRCCGTTGVLAPACARIAEQQDPYDSALVLVADVAARTIRDIDGARWSNLRARWGALGIRARVRRLCIGDTFAGTRWARPSRKGQQPLGRNSGGPEFRSRTSRRGRGR